MKVKLVLTLISMVVLIAGSSIAVSLAIENQGAEKIELEGGKRGKVPFPHRQHQKNLGDCQICHSIFPQEPGAIQELKAQGTLKKKYVMNKLCTKCHKEKKKAGQQSGPTTCKKCHIKKKS
ncbi:MAG: cytochrome c family protein [Deltaproteobacteria bacterium]|nr:cytochrome c family protein [Deltaproteobacteria bacterium]